MKKNIHFLFAVVFLFTAVLLTLLSCKKDNDRNSNGEIPDETSSYWEDDYRRECLHGKVKSVIEYSSEEQLNAGFYTQKLFDQNGNRVEDANYKDGKLYEGGKFKHNAQNNITRWDYYSGYKLDGITEYTYGGPNSHNAYLPSDFNNESLGLTKGITGVRWYSADSGEELFSLKCTSVKGNQIDLRVGGSYFGFKEDEENYIVIKTKGAYPAELTAKGPNVDPNNAKVAELFYGNDGIPNKIILPGSKTNSIMDFILKDGFCMLSSQVKVDVATGATENIWKFTYNSKGYLESESYRNGTPITYQYEYDAKGNWTKQESSKGEILYRKYTYR